MTAPVIAALIAAGFVALADWIAVAREDRMFERIAKPGVIVCLLAAVVVAGLGTSAVRWLLLLALAASLAGDWLLLPPVRFTGGLAAFLGAHVAYLALFLLGDLQAGPALLGAGAAAVLLATAGRRILAGARHAGMGGPVVAYFGAICLMAIAAAATGSPLAAAGATLFVVSDTVLGWDRFVARAALSPTAAARRRVAVIVTYHAAQVLLAIAVLGSSLS